MTWDFDKYFIRSNLAERGEYDDYASTLKQGDKNYYMHQSSLPLIYVIFIYMHERATWVQHTSKMLSK